MSPLTCVMHTQRHALPITNAHVPLTCVMHTQRHALPITNAHVCVPLHVKWATSAETYGGIGWGERAQPPKIHLCPSQINCFRRHTYAMASQRSVRKCSARKRNKRLSCCTVTERRSLSIKMCYRLYYDLYNDYLWNGPLLQQWWPIAV